MTPEKPDRCKDGFWAPLAHIGHKLPYIWRLVPVAGDDSYQIIAESRPDGCLKYLGASQSCNVGNVTLFANDDGSRRQRWVLRESKGAVATSPPSAPISTRLASPLYSLLEPQLAPSPSLLRKVPPLAFLPLTAAISTSPLLSLPQLLKSLVWSLVLKIY